MVERLGINSDGFPEEEGVYKIRFPDEKDEREIDVYLHPVKGLSCYQDDFGSSGTGVDPETDCHVSVQNTGLEFITKLRDLD